MANDDKVKKDLVPLGSKFLPEEIANIDGMREVYSLEDEFAKTKKNKNWMVLITLLIFVLLISALTFLFTYYSNRKDKNIDINISEFDDLRLREVLNSTRLTGNNLLIRRNEMYSLILEMKNQILEINNRYLAKENAVLDKGGSVKDRIADLRRAEQSEINSVVAKYDAKIKEKKTLIGELEKEKQEADRKLQNENKNIGKAGDEDKVYAMKMKSLSDTYQGGINLMADYYDRYVRYLVSKYNPVFTSGDLKSNLDRNAKRNEGKILRDYDELFLKENVISKKRFDDLRVKISDHDFLVQRLMGIGYENSIPPALKSISNLSVSIVNDYENLWFGLVTTIKQKNSQIEDYKVALDAVLRERPESGYIISAVNPSKISIHINRLIKVKEGDTAQVFRTDDEYIGKIQFYRTPDGLKAKVVQLAGSKKMRPFDRILLKIK
jgi:hypothetical protein